MDPTRDKEKLERMSISIMYCLDDCTNLVESDEMFNLHIYACAFPCMAAHINNHIVTHDVPSTVKSGFVNRGHQCHLPKFMRPYLLQLVDKMQDFCTVVLRASPTEEFCQGTQNIFNSAPVTIIDCSAEFPGVKKIP